MYEREVSKQFSAALGGNFERNIGQARDGGCDINVGPLVIECKRRKTLTTIEKWYAQASAARVTSEQLPLIVARADAGSSLVIISLDDFLRIARTSAALASQVSE